MTEKKIESIKWAISTLYASAYSSLMRGYTKEFWLDNIADQACLDLLSELQVKHLMLHAERKVEIQKKEREKWL
jgi:hypothetical protein